MWSQLGVGLHSAFMYFYSAVLMQPHNLTGSGSLMDHFIQVKVDWDQM